MIEQKPSLCKIFDLKARRFWMIFVLLGRRKALCLARHNRAKSAEIHRFKAGSDSSLYPKHFLYCPYCLHILLDGFPVCGKRRLVCADGCCPHSVQTVLARNRRIYCNKRHYFLPQQKTVIPDYKQTTAYWMNGRTQFAPTTSTEIVRPFVGAGCSPYTQT